MNKIMSRIAALVSPELIRKLLSPVFIISLLAIAVSGYGGLYSYKQYESKGGEPVAGKEVYMTYCAACHGLEGHGDGPAASSLPHRPANISRRLESLVVYDSSLINGAILRGRVARGMPAFEGLITEEEAKNVLAYIRDVNASND